MQDTSNNDFSPLFGLALVPMDDDSLGRIGDETEAPLYIASEAERKLLKAASRSIIASEGVIGQYLQSRLSKQEIIDSTNIRKLSAIDVLKLLRDILPASWSDGSNLGVVDRSGVVTDEWLKSLWEYLLESNSLHLFSGILPLLPVSQYSSRYIHYIMSHDHRRYYLLRREAPTNSLP